MSGPPGGWAGASPDARPHHQQSAATKHTDRDEHSAQQVSDGAAQVNGQARDDDQQPVEHLPGPHLAQLLRVPEDTPLSAAVGIHAAVRIIEWVRIVLTHGHDFPDELGTATSSDNPSIGEIPAIPVFMVVEALAAAGAAVPTRCQAREWLAECDLSEYDVDLEIRAAALTVDPELFNAVAEPREARICGVPQSVFDELTEPEQAKVREGKVIAPPQAPLPVARWLARHVFAVRCRPPGARRRSPGAPLGPRRRVWMTTLLRVDQTWYHYAEHTAGDPPYWKAHLDPEWIRRRLRDALADCWYVRSHTESGRRVYDGLKWWNPDDRSLTQVENALADITAAAAGGSGVGARELCDLYGRFHGAYRGGRLVLVRNGVLDVTTGRLVDATPLWFDLTRIEAVYNHHDHVDGAAQFMSVLQAQWADDPGSILLLQMWFGYVISGRRDLQKMMWIFGEPGTAKSLIAAVLRALVGNATTVSVEALNSHFGLQEIYEKGSSLTVMPDVRHWSKDSSRALSLLLSIVGTDEVEVHRKYKSTVTSALPVRFHGTSNLPPPLSDHTGALIDRLLLLETTCKVRDTAADIKGFDRQIIATELGSVLRWAVEGLALLDAAGGRFAKPEREAEMRDEIEESMSNVKQFLGETTTIITAADHKHAAGSCGCVWVDELDLFRVFDRWAEMNKTGTRTSKAAFRRAITSRERGIQPGQRNDGQRLVWGIGKAETVYVERDRFDGTDVRRIASTDPAVNGDLAGGDPFAPNRGAPL